MFIGDTEVSTVYYGDTKAYENSIDEERQYLTFVPVSDATFTWTNHANSGSLYYSLNNGSTWTALGDGESTPMITAGKKILWKGDSFNPSYDGIGTFSSDADNNASGNIMSLLYGDDFCANDKSIHVKNAFESLFNGDTHILTPPLLPAISLSRNCYTNMFYGCTNLVAVPKLPATTLTFFCYNAMFSGCTSLTTAPELPATTLANYCYESMFYGCTSLTTAPELPATTLKYGCYANMFYECASLTIVPELPATTLQPECYSRMFYKCTSITTAPELPAKTLVKDCYTAMFYGCAKLNYIKCLATNPTTGTRVPTTYWVLNIPSKGTFVKAAGVNWSEDYQEGSGKPYGWTVVDA